MKRIDTPVLIVGAGPVGLTAGLLLSRLGVGHQLVERRAEPQRAPAAHVVNARTFEIFRQIGVDVGAIAAAAVDPADAGFVYWVEKLGGEVLGRLPFERQGDDVLAVTPTPLRNLSQHRLEPILLDSLTRSGVAAPRYGVQWESAEQDDDGVRSRLRDLATGEQIEVHSRWLIAADGAGSRVRKWLDIPQRGPERLQSFVMVHFAANLRDRVRACPGVLYWICDPDCGGTFVAHDIDREWVYMIGFDPDRESLEDYDEKRCEERVRRAIAGDAEVSIRTLSTWTMTAQVAERYRAGRVFLVGDAAHRFPPTGGLGLNTGVQDAHNLIWKLARVDAGLAAEALLDSYEIERRPVAQNNADQSLRNAVRLLEVPRALDLRAEPGGLQRVAAAIANQAEHFDMLGLQLGFAYEAGALIADGTSAPAPANPVRDFVPTSRPGSRLPHGWLERAGRRVSTLDLVAADRFTLLAGTDASRWIDAAVAADASIRCLRIGVDVADPGAWWQTVAAMEPGGALLVRPDQHIAFRSRGAGADPRAALDAALAALRGEPSSRL